MAVGDGDGQTDRLGFISRDFKFPFSLEFPGKLIPRTPGKSAGNPGNWILLNKLTICSLFYSDFPYIVSISNIIVSNATQIIHWVISLVPTTIWH
jgi:hypothetical protein